MIVDTSAILAALLEEAEADRILALLSAAEQVRMSAGSWIELQAVSTRRFGGKIDAPVYAFKQRYRIEVVPVSLNHAELAREAYRQYGRGTNHPARLNFGDCFAYALAKATGEPLLFKGDDFGHTDVVAAL